VAEGAGRARPEDADRTGPTRRLRRVAVALAGPALIAGSVLVVLHEFAFGGRLAPSDLSTYFLPTYCFLGKSLAGGHIPAWNPYTLAGTPFAADPQSGWMYAPAMLLFTVLPCAAAIQVMVVIQPILAGLGLLWFLRIEGASRPVATTGGVALALGVAGSTLGISLPFAGALAWSAVLLALAARYVRARSTPGRLTWLGLVGLAWGQLAAAHFSTGLVIGTAALAAYLVAAALRNVREGAWSISLAALLVGGLMSA